MSNKQVLKSLAISALLLASVPPTLGAVIYVDIDAAGNNDGSSWTHAYNDLQDALEAATPQTEIWVAEGTYRPSALLDPNDARSASFAMRNNVAIYGGFAGTETSRSQRDYTTNITIPSGDLADNDAGGFEDLSRGEYACHGLHGTLCECRSCAGMLNLCDWFLSMRSRF